MITSATHGIFTATIYSLRYLAIQPQHLRAVTDNLQFSIDGRIHQIVTCFVHLLPKHFSQPLISLEEQPRIVQKIESPLRGCDKLRETLAAARKQSEALRQSIWKQAQAGKLVALLLNPDGLPA